MSTVGKEVAPDPGQHDKAADHDQRKDNEYPGAMPQVPLEQRHVRVRAIARSAARMRREPSQPAPAAVAVVQFGRQQVIHHRGDDRSRKQVRRQHRKRDGQRQRREQVLGRPVKKQHRTNTMLIVSVETKVGPAICIAPSRIAWRRGFPRLRLRWMFSISTVASSTRIPTASASPPNVMTFNECPSKYSMMIEDKIASGIETATISVLRSFREYENHRGGE